MMEPVAWKWEDKTGAEWLCGDRDDAQQAAAIVGAVAEPLVRLSDAEARIAELEAALADMTAKAERQLAGWVKAEALLKEAGKVLEPFAKWEPGADERPGLSLSDDVGLDEFLTGFEVPTIGHLRAARSLASKIGGGE